MATTPTTTVRVDPALKDEAMGILEPLGLSMSGAVTIFLKAVVRARGIPFDMRIDADATQTGAGRRGITGAE